MKNMEKTFEKGRSMLEMLAVLAIIAFISIGVSSGIGHALMLYRASVLKTQLSQIQKAVKNYYSFETKVRKYADIDDISQAKYKDMLGDILGKDACHPEKEGCTTPVGQMQLFPVFDGLGFKIALQNVQRDICYELLDSIQNRGGALYGDGLVMANTCNNDSKQLIEFASLPGNLISNNIKKCTGNQVYSPDENDCVCLSEDAFVHDNPNNPEKKDCLFVEKE